MCKVIAVSSNKGGVAKTTSTLNLGIGLARKGKKDLLIDVDGQADLTKCLGIRDPEKLDYHENQVLRNLVFVFFRHLPAFFHLKRSCR